MSMQRSICRTCHNLCGVLVEVEHGKVLRVTGDHEDPVYHGYSCTKGRAHPVLYDHPDRVMRPLKRNPDGSRTSIVLQRAIDEIAGRLNSIIDEHGIRAVAVYQGTHGFIDNPANMAMLDAFMRALGSPMLYSAASIDQSGKPVALAMHGVWMAPGYDSIDPDVMLCVGKNPLVSHSGAWSANPGDFFKDLEARGAPLIVIDPRRTETARRATIHLQPRPGHDAMLLAAILQVILEEGLEDQAFIEEHVTGVDELRTALRQFSPWDVADRADVPFEDLVEAARVYAGGRRGFAGAGTGPNMTGDPTLVEYLLLCLHSVCGHWMRDGETVRNALTMAPAYVQMARAQAMPPFPGHGFGESARVRGVGQTAFGMPTATLADEILLDGAGQVRALVSLGGNPVVGWPDQRRTLAAMSKLELLVQTDVVLSATAKLADYVIPAKLPYEQPGTTLLSDFLSAAYPGSGLPTAYGRYTPALVDAPADVVDHPTFLFLLAQAMGLELEVHPGFGSAIPGGNPVRLDMAAPLDIDQLFDLVHSGSRIPLDTIKKHPGGALYPEPAVVVAPKDDGWDGRLDVANADMINALNAVAVRETEHPEFPFRLISRRLPHVYNSPTVAMPGNRPKHNPAFVHPADLQSLGLTTGSVAHLRSPRGTITAIVQADDTMRLGTISMSHAWGDAPDAGEAEAPIPGSCTSVLIDNDGVYDPYTGQPQMSNIPITFDVPNTPSPRV